MKAKDAKIWMNEYVGIDIDNALSYFEDNEELSPVITEKLEKAMNDFADEINMIIAYAE